MKLCRNKKEGRLYFNINEKLASAINTQINENLLNSENHHFLLAYIILCAFSTFILRLQKVILGNFIMLDINFK